MGIDGADELDDTTPGRQSHGKFPHQEGARDRHTMILRWGSMLGVTHVDAVDHQPQRGLVRVTANPSSAGPHSRRTSGSTPIRSCCDRRPVAGPRTVVLSSSAQTGHREESSVPTSSEGVVAPVAMASRSARGVAPSTRNPPLSASGRCGATTSPPARPPPSPCPRRARHEARPVGALPPSEEAMGGKRFLSRGETNAGSRPIDPWRRIQTGGLCRDYGPRTPPPALAGSGRRQSAGAPAPGEGHQPE